MYQNQQENEQMQQNMQSEPNMGAQPQAQNTEFNQGVHNLILMRIDEEIKKNPNFGFNALTNEFGDMIKAGVIEPAKVATASLINAASVASMILTTECLVTDAPEPEKQAAPPMGGMPGMM